VERARQAAAAVSDPFAELIGAFNSMMVAFADLPERERVKVDAQKAIRDKIAKFVKNIADMSTGVARFLSAYSAVVEGEDRRLMEAFNLEKASVVNYVMVAVRKATAACATMKTLRVRERENMSFVQAINALERTCERLRQNLEASMNKLQSKGDAAVQVGICLGDSCGKDSVLYPCQQCMAVEVDTQCNQCTAAVCGGCWTGHKTECDAATRAEIAAAVK